jgi:UDP-N-acetylmuramate--alanine ligase
MKLEHIERVYLIGIGGIGMSGLARYFNRRDCVVAGYDRVRTPLTKALEEEGISITYQDELSEIPADFLVHDPNTLVIYTPAIPLENKVYQHFLTYDYILRKRSEVLGIISEGSFTIAIAGTHGKTTTSSMVAHVLKHTGYDCSAFLGGIASNYNTNVLFGENNVMVIEADEFDRSFLTLHPDIAVITSMDADHLDIYGDKNRFEEGFRLFASQLKRQGTLIYKYSLPLKVTGVTYGINSTSSDYTAHNIRVVDGDFIFDFKNGNVEIKDIRMGIAGLHNIENATAAIIVALKLDIAAAAIKKALAAFTGVKRRFEYIVRNEKHIYIDDYAHHPEELRACLASIRQLYPQRHITAIFQPHLFSRTRDFAEGFSEVLSNCDRLFLLDIYPAREKPMAGVSSAMLMDGIQMQDKVLSTKADVLNLIDPSTTDVLVTLGAGDIDTLVQPLQTLLKK